MKKLFSFFLLIILFSCQKETSTSVDPIEQNTKLKDHSLEFKKGVIEVAKGVHVAIGYALANAILIEGEGGNIIVDTTGTIETATEVKKEFDKINSNPVVAIIYTHNHGDHIYGAKVFAENSSPDIYAHRTTQDYINRVLGIVRPIISDRSSKMFGNRFPLNDITNNGIGPFLEIGRDSRNSGLLVPNITFDEKLNINISGIEIELIHAPGETNDQLLVWLPEKKVLLPGDNFYKAFPNLYTIRGTPYRDLVRWVASLDIMRYLKPEFLIPSHTRPILGKNKIYEALTEYRDGIQYVHDQTIRLMNKGMTPNQIASQIKLPPKLKDSIYLQEFYGSPSWSSRNVFSGYLGWFDGNPTNLHPLDPQEESIKILQLAGGVERVLSEIKESYENEDYQWVLQLTDYLLEYQDNQEAVDIRISALNKLAEIQSNPNARYYYLSSAQDLIKPPETTLLTTPSKELLTQYPIDILFETLKVNVIPENALGNDMRVLFKFTDTNKSFTLILRNGVLEVQPYALEGSDIQVITVEQTWKEVVVGLRSLPVAIATGSIEVSGQQLRLISFFNTFKE